MDKISQIINNPLYVLLFGSGGILVVITSVIALNGKVNKRKGKKVKINIDISDSEQSERNDIVYNFVFDKTIQVDKLEDYQNTDFRKEEYYISFLKTVEEKKKAGDDIEYK